MKDEIYDLYKNNPEFKEYVNRYAKSHDLGIFEALAHITIEEVADYYKEKSPDRTVSSDPMNCDRR